MALSLARAAINLLAVVLTVGILFGGCVAIATVSGDGGSTEGSEAAAAGVAGGALFLGVWLFFRLRGALTRRLLGLRAQGFPDR